MSSCGAGILSLNGMFSSGSAGVIDWTLLVQVWIASMTAVWLLLIVFMTSSCSSRLMVRASVMAPPRGLYVANYTKHSVDLSSEGSPATAEVRSLPESAAAGARRRRESAPDVFTGRVREDRVSAAAHRRRPDAITGTALRPLGPVLPPGAALPGGGRTPAGRFRRVAVGCLVPCLRAGRVDNAGYMAATGQDVPDVASQQSGGLVRRVPGHDVIVNGAHHVGVVLHL